jgi:hypothetical protein
MVYRVFHRVFHRLVEAVYFLIRLNLKVTKFSIGPFFVILKSNKEISRKLFNINDTETGKLKIIYQTVRRTG